MKTLSLEKLLVRPVVRSLAWARLHPFLTLAILFLLFIVPPFVYVAYKTVEWIYDWLRSLGDTGKKVAESFRSTVASINEQFRERPWLVTVTLFVITLIAPPVGVLLWLWRLVDLFKKKTTPEDVGLPPEPSPANSVNPSNIINFPLRNGPA